MQHAFTWKPVESGGAPAGIRNAVRQASAETGVSFSYLMEKAAVESGYRTDAKAPTSSATGLFQFIESTWLGMVRDYGARFGLEEYANALQSGRVDRATRREILSLREDPTVSAQMAAQYARNNQDHLKRTVGGPVGDTELYLAHFLGPGGAEKFLRAMRANPARPAGDVVPDAADSNRSVFYTGGRPRTLRQVYDRFAAKFQRGSGEMAVANVQPGSVWGSTVSKAGAAAKGGTPLRPGALTASASLPAPAPGQVPMMASPASYAARMFFAELSFPGDKAKEPTAKPAGGFTA